VNSVTTGTAVTSSADPSTYGGSVTFTATVTGSDGGGTVAFFADGSATPIASCGSEALTASGSGSVATCSTSALTAGTHAITAAYSGDSDYDGSSGTLSGGQVVDPAPLAVDVTGAQVYGGSATFAVARYSGFVNGDAASVVTGTLTGCTTSVAPGSDVGTYFGTISGCTGLSAANYAISYVDAGVTVGRAPLVADVAGTQTYGGTPVFAVVKYSGFANGDSASVVGGTLSGCKTSVTSSAGVGTYAGTISGCTGLSAANYTISYADAGVTVNQADLTITASSGSMTYGGTPPTITPSFSGFVNGDGPASLATAPSCSTAATSASPVGSYPSTCSGAADPNYSIGYVSGQVTVGQAGTTLVYTGPESISAGTGLVPAATLTSPASACESGQQVTFALNANPATGVAGTYTLESATTGSSGSATGASVSTKNWQAGAYAITASYAGTANCAAATVTEPLAVTVPGLGAAGAGGYTVSGAGAVGFGFIVAQVPHTSSYLGAISLINNGKWEFTGTITSYVMTSSTQGTLAGTGSLSWWNPALNSKRGGWQLAKSGVAFTAGFGVTTKTAPGSFGIKISYTPVLPQPTVLPNSSPINLSSGAIVIA
jgi:MBG domain (YGX type)/Bacterial Ig-like domain (group 3)